MTTLYIDIEKYKKQIKTIAVKGFQIKGKTMIQIPT